MWQGRTLQIKIVKDDQPKYHRLSSPQEPVKKEEDKTQEIIYATMGAVVVSYTACKTVNFFFKVAEHLIIK